MNAIKERLSETVRRYHRLKKIYYCFQPSLRFSPCLGVRLLLTHYYLGLIQDFHPIGLQKFNKRTNKLNVTFF